MRTGRIETGATPLCHRALTHRFPKIRSLIAVNHGPLESKLIR
jgi:hypothetical protein